MTDKEKVEFLKFQLRLKFYFKPIVGSFKEKNNRLLIKMIRKHLRDGNGNLGNVETLANYLWDKKDNKYKKLYDSIMGYEN